jgi:hypothetical protein
MSAESYSLEQVDQMIDYLDKHIAAGKDTPTMLNTLQQRLDIIDMTYRQDPRFDEVYPHLLELQALIFGRRQQDDKAMKFMKEAVRQAGSVRNLHSQTIRKYIAAHSQTVTTRHHQQHHQTHQQHRQEAQHHHQVQRHQQQAHQEQQVEAVYHEQQRKRRPGKFASLFRLKPRSTKVAFATVAGLLLLSIATFNFVPQVHAFSSMLVNHSEIDAAKKNFEMLTSEFSQCSAQLNQERGSINTSDTSAVDSFNSQEQQCSAVQQQQNLAANKYDSLISSH